MPSEFSHSPWFDVALTALAPIIWGSTYIVTSELLPPDRPFIAAFLRTLPAGLLLLMWCRRAPLRSEWWRLLFLAALNLAFFQAFLFVAAYRLPGGLAAIIGALSPLIVMGLARIVDQVIPARRVLLVACLGVLGMAGLLLSSNTKWDSIGVLAAFLGTFSMASGAFLTRRWQINLPVLASTGWQLVLSGLMLAPLAYYLDPPLPSLDAKQIAAYLYLGIAGALIAYSLWFRGVLRLPSVAVASIGLLSPLSAVILGWLFLGQRLHGSALISGILVLCSVLAMQYLNTPKPT